MSLHSNYNKYINQLRGYIEQTNSDKYSESLLDQLEILMHPAYGQGAFAYNAVKYLNRYLSRGYQKSNNREDLLKLMHIILFELERTDNETD